jgi:hypothetical protein
MRGAEILRARWGGCNENFDIYHDDDDVLYLAT